MRWLALTPLVFALASCNAAPSDVRPWRATDHDHTDNPNSGQVDVGDAGQSGMMGIDEVALAAWKQNCVPCHGIIGRGDGPKGIGVGARNLTDPAWQATITDDQIEKSLREGKGQMPKADLPESTLKQLVKLVRLLNASRMARGEAEDEAPEGSAPTSDAGSDGGTVADAGKKAADAGNRTDAGPRRAPDAGNAP